MSETHNGTVLKQITYNGQKVKKWYHNGVRVFSAGSTVTYYVDSGTSYTEEVDSGASCLSPTSFTPTKSGWTFVGWREDTTASSSVLSSKIMGDSPITLYAVFKQTVTISYNGNGATSGSVSSQTGYAYLNAYDSNTVSYPSFTLPANGFAKTNYTFAQWRAGSTSGTAYAPGATITLSSNTTMYAEWFVSSLVVYSATYSTGAEPDTVVDLYNTNYVNVPESEFEASVWYRLGTDTTTRTININYGRYTKARIEYMVYVNNTHTDRTVSLKINGAGASTTHLSYPYTYDTRATAVTMELSATNNDHTETWVWINVCVTKITLYA